MDLLNYIGGSWQPSSDGATTEVMNPATDEVIATVPVSTTADVDAAVEAAGAAFPEWADKTPRQRSEALFAVADVIEDNLDELRRLEMDNVG